VVTTPSAVTTVITSTAGNGQVTTITQVGVNQTLSPNNDGSKNSSFFRNTGAVAGVFVLVGLAAAAILLFIFFAVRRRRRNRQIEHDSAVSATLAAAGFHRTPLDDDDDEHVAGSRRMASVTPDAELNQRSSSRLALGSVSSVPSGARTSAYLDTPHQGEPDTFDPYQDYIALAESHPSNNAPPPSSWRPRTRTNSSGPEFLSHSASGSYEPLLASYQRTAPPSPPPRNPLRLSDAARSSPPSTLPLLPPASGEEIVPRTPSLHSARSTADDRLDPKIRYRLVDHASQKDFKDEEDYSRPVFGVRNLLSTTRTSEDS